MSDASTVDVEDSATDFGVFCAWAAHGSRNSTVSRNKFFITSKLGVQQARLNG
jgi:hypothetical protein